MRPLPAGDVSSPLGMHISPHETIKSLERDMIRLQNLGYVTLLFIFKTYFYRSLIIHVRMKHFHLHQFQ